MSRKGNKTVETKLGPSYTPKIMDVFEENMNDRQQKIQLPIRNNHTTQKQRIEVFEEPQVSHKVSLETSVSKLNLNRKSPVPEPKLSPLRSRYRERSVGKTPIQEQPHPLTQKKNENKPKKKVVVDIKSPPKVFKSPTWYKSPSKRLVNDQDVVLKQLLLKDARYTEQDIQKILNDHK
jgi:hypothetical protein